MKRIVMVLAVLATWPFLTAGGGINPGSDTNKMLGNPGFSFVAVIDPHAAGGDPCDSRESGFCAFESEEAPSGIVAKNVTTTAKRASVRLTRSGVTTQAQFQILPEFPLYLGCETNLTEQRFLYAPTRAWKLRHWIPSIDMQTLFQPHGVTPDNEAVQPVITSITTNVCVTDPNNPTAYNPQTGGSVSGGLLVLHGTVELLVPARR